MASPLAKNLIAGAIGESGAAIPPTMAPVSLVEAERNGTEFLTKAGIENITELRSLSTRAIYEIYNESSRFGFPLVIDGYFLPKSLTEIFESKEQAQIPLLAGWNSAEILGIAYMQGQPFTPEAFITRTKQTYPEDFETALALHPHKTSAEVERSATDLAADRFIAYSTWKWLDLHKKNSNQPTYRYLYSKLRPSLVDKNLATGLAGGTVKADNTASQPKAMGAPHACEIEYAMGNLERVTEFAWTTYDFKVSETMLNYFANFIKYGNPNGENLPQWDAMNTSDDEPAVMIIDTESKQIKSNSEKRYQFHDNVFSEVK
jgi:para-nitrobenzyl esterase